MIFYNKDLSVDTISEMILKSSSDNEANDPSEEIIKPRITKQEALDSIDLLREFFE